jgi:hypothetical protein
MVFNCKECRGAHSLGENICLKGIVEGFSQEYNVDTITLSHYIESQYFGDSVELIRHIIKFGNEMDNLSMRDPIAEYFGALPSRDRKKLKTFSQDIIAFDTLFTNTLDLFERSEPGSEQCAKCTSTTVEDLSYVCDIYEKIGRFILRQGFRVILERPTSMPVSAPSIRHKGEGYEIDLERPVYVAGTSSGMEPSREATELFTQLQTQVRRPVSGVAPPPPTPMPPSPRPKPTVTAESRRDSQIPSPAPSPAPPSTGFEKKSDIKIKCPNCGNPIRIGWRGCPICGTSLKD